MADSTEPRGSLIKREEDLPAADPIASKSSSGWMLASALLLTISIGWALYDEAFLQRPKIIPIALHRASERFSSRIKSQRNVFACWPPW